MVEFLVSKQIGLENQKKFDFKIYLNFTDKYLGINKEKSKHIQLDDLNQIFDIHNEKHQEFVKEVLMKYTPNERE